MKIINVYLDTSGSMDEMGKGSALLYIAKSIKDYCKFKSIETCFYKLDKTKIVNMEGVKFSNDVKLSKDNFLSNSILLSDGLFEIEGKKIFDVAIAVGVDADELNLNKFSSKLFTSDNVIKALEYLLFNNDLLGKSLNKDEDEW
ncbi:hypothetical protein V6246_00725 [Algibacter sp. TI.3.09]|uniref:hypothetical protein n=1 Tax=Algibacter sp. TI.3.09 TaxID=3121298 RepID=UPI00311F12E9